MSKPMPLALVAVALLAPPSPGCARAELLVSAAASLSDALPEVARAWEASGGERVAFNFAASSTLASQIEAGAPVDLVFTADEETMDRLERAKLLAPSTRRPLLANRLAIVVPEGRPYRLSSAPDLARSEVKRLALADPAAVPAGRYARRWLESRGLWSALERRVVPTLNVRAALATVAAGEADAGIVYATDVRALAGVELAFEVAAEEGPRIVYPAAVVGSSKRGAEARRLLDFLAGDVARATFGRFGFAAPTP
jgi:molybdate transport system substrate-binding protein